MHGELFGSIRIRHLVGSALAAFGPSEIDANGNNASLNVSDRKRLRR
jgi:hypothetical protein